VASYRISQLADRVGLRASTLRLYEQEGLLAARRSEAGYRLYDEEAVERLGVVAAGKHLGLPSQEIREVLSVGRAPTYEPGSVRCC
jgi:MerR family copper efflux transcriptional regulator